MSIRPRPGRPKRDQAGEVERRLLDAATALFLSRGYEGTSCEEVAGEAGAGKASLYARFRNKEALFAAVIRRDVERTLLPAADIDVTATLVDRLRTVGIRILQHVLEPHTVAMMRLVVATADRFPSLAHAADRIGWEGGVQRVLEAIEAGADAPGRPEERRVLSEWFIRLVFVPQQMRALLGDDADLLRADAPAQVEIALGLLAECRMLPAREGQRRESE